jgi:hypothetical protein
VREDETHSGPTWSGSLNTSRLPIGRVENPRVSEEARKCNGRRLPPTECVLRRTPTHRAPYRGEQNTLPSVDAHGCLTIKHTTKPILIEGLRSWVSLCYTVSRDGSTRTTRSTDSQTEAYSSSKDPTASGEHWRHRSGRKFARTPITLLPTCGLQPGPNLTLSGNQNRWINRTPEAGYGAVWRQVRSRHDIGQRDGIRSHRSSRGAMHEPSQQRCTGQHRMIVGRQQ